MLRNITKKVMPKKSSSDKQKGINFSIHHQPSLSENEQSGKEKSVEMKEVFFIKSIENNGEIGVVYGTSSFYKQVDTQLIIKKRKGDSFQTKSPVKWSSDKTWEAEIHLDSTFTNGIWDY